MLLEFQFLIIPEHPGVFGDSCRDSFSFPKVLG
jgi:hypothetical protein